MEKDFRERLFEEVTTIINKTPSLTGGRDDPGNYISTTVSVGDLFDGSYGRWRCYFVTLVALFQI